MTRTLNFFLLCFLLLAGCSSMDGEDCAPEDLECYCETNPENCLDEPAKTNETPRTDENRIRER